MKEFRKLLAEEIECRIATIKKDKSGLSLLLYKDARVDQRLLDETVGPMNWQRHHSRDNANCTVSIWDDEKKIWIEKEDVGTESYTEAQKGLASDSFKRACFNWGIGRELYTAPAIWVNPPDCEIKEVNGKNVCYDKFIVSKIGYADNGDINALEIKNEKTNKTVFIMGRPTAEAPKVSKKNQALIDEIREICEVKRFYEPQVLQVSKVDSLEECDTDKLQEIKDFLASK